MELSHEDAPSSIWMVRAAELFPKPVLEKEDFNLVVPFNELAGESVKHLGRIENGILALSNYRVFILLSSNSTEISIPLGLVEQVQIKDIINLFINCKNACVFKCTFATSESCIEWHRRIMLATGIPEQLENLFAFPFHAWVSESPPTSDTEWYGRLQRTTDYDDDFRNEVERLSFDMQGAWRISYANVDFKLCQSYPKNLIVPACITDETLLNVASFRSSRRIPAVVWRHKQSGAVIARCSQPEVGWLGWRNNKDESLLKALADACAFDNGLDQQTKTAFKPNSCSNINSEIISASSSPEGSNPEVVTANLPKRNNPDKPFKVLIVDARSYASAVTNRARGGGVECAEYYPSAEIQFMSLGNIHAIRKSFHSLRQLCASPPDNANWFSLLERTMWLQHISALITASVNVCIAIEHQSRPVLIHCSDGWDRTPQISSTAQLCLDPYYRTVDGFRILVEKEWLSFGHKFADRCGHGVGSDETNERCPVFLQWIDCVHQIHRQFPCAFEFGMAYLIKLAQHAHSCLFGTFLCNTYKERLENSVPDRTFSVWPFLSGPMYKNPLYMPNRERVLWPAQNIRDLEIWGDVYLGSLRNNQNPIDYPANNVQENDINNHDPNIVKTRSYDNLSLDPVILNCNGLIRRSSDPNIIENSMITPLNISDENSIASNESTANSLNLFANKLSDSMLNSGIQSTSVENTDAVHDDDLETTTNDSDVIDGQFRNKKNLILKNTKDSTWHGCVDKSTDTLVPMIASALLMDSINNELIFDSAIGEENSCNHIKVKMKNDNSFKFKAEVHSSGKIEKCSVNCNDLVQGGAEDMAYQNDITEAQDRSKTTNFRRQDSYKIDINESVSSESRLSTPGLKSLPVTPPGILLERSTLSFPDGLSHGLSEQNLRLQQIVYEHKIKEDALQRELHAMRVALMKKPTCFQCNNVSNNNLVPDEISAKPPKVNEEEQNVYNFILQCIENNYNNFEIDDSFKCVQQTACDILPSLVDCNQENSSVCSWEAVADNNSNSSSNFSNVLWVPDHSVSRCQKCEIEFWLGRRKHHCRSCGSIFCSDCSNFFAHILDEKPARLCANCYRSLNGKMLENQLIQNTYSAPQTNSTDNTKNNNVTEHQI